MKNKIPMCWKCASRITTDNNDKWNGKTFVGCKDNDDIHDYDDAQKLCPLLDKMTV